MLIHTRAIGFTVTEAIRGYVEARVRSALWPYTRWVTHVVVRLEDVNGPRGGRDMRCRMMVSVCRRGVVIVEAQAEDLYCAIDHARDRLRRAVSRAMSQRQTRERRTADLALAPA